MPKDSQVIVTFLDEQYPLLEQESAGRHNQRKYKRHKANGEIEIRIGEEGTSYTLHNYSVGGLSFISDQDFETGKKIKPSILLRRKADKPFELHCEVIVRYSTPNATDHKVGCQFRDSVDEDLWYDMMRRQVDCKHIVPCTNGRRIGHSQIV